MGDVRVSDEAAARKALRIAGCRPQEVDRLAGAFAAVAGELRREVVGQIAQTAVVRPGDTLIVRVDPRATLPATADRLVKELRSALPDVDVLLVGADELAVYRPEASE